MKIGPYEVIGPLGKGGMGQVYRARSPAGEEVAVKVLLATDAARIARFERERRLLTTFTERDGFVPLLDAGSTPRGPYIVMPIVPGGTLRDRLCRGPLGMDETIALGRALASALGVAHKLGIVHRDLKPENVLFTTSGRPLVADLGLGKHFDKEAPGASQSVLLSQHGSMRGTLGYMPPEQMLDATSVEPEADVFALGAILYECLAWRPAFDGESFGELIDCVRAGKIEPLAKRRPETPAWLVAAIETALAPRPEARFADGQAFLAALSPPARPAVSRLRRLLGLLAAISVVLAVSLAITLWPEPSRPRVAPLPPTAVLPRAVQPPLAGRLATRVERLLADAGVSGSVAVLDGDGHPLVLIREQTPLPLGACMMLVTAAAALRAGSGDLVTELELGPRGADGHPSGLAVVGGGDPTIDDAAVAEWAQALRREGVEHIEGEIHVDARRFALQPEQRVHPTWKEDEGPSLNPGNIRVTALSFHDGCVSYFPSREIGQRVVPALSKMSVEPIGGVGAPLVRLQGSSGDWTVRLTGSPTNTVVIPVEYPELFLGVYLKEALVAAKIQVDGMVNGVSPEVRFDGWSPVESCRRKTPIDFVLWYVGHNAKWIYAETIFRNLGVGMHGEPSTFESSARAVEDFVVQECRAARGEVAIVDGSGRSPGTRMSARALALVVKHAVQDGATGGRFAESLAHLPGEERAGRQIVKALFAFRELEEDWTVRGTSFVGQCETDGADALAGRVQHGDRRVFFALLGAKTPELQRGVLEALADYVEER